MSEGRETREMRDESEKMREGKKKVFFKEISDGISGFEFKLETDTFKFTNTESELEEPRVGSV